MNSQGIRLSYCHLVCQTRIGQTSTWDLQFLEVGNFRSQPNMEVLTSVWVCWECASLGHRHLGTARVQNWAFLIHLGKTLRILFPTLNFINCKTPKIGRDRPPSKVKLCCHLLWKYACGTSKLMHECVFRHCVSPYCILRAVFPLSLAMVVDIIFWKVNWGKLIRGRTSSQKMSRYTNFLLQIVHKKNWPIWQLESSGYYHHDEWQSVGKPV